MGTDAFILELTNSNMLEIATRCAGVITQSGIIASPTDTVYGMIGKADEEIHQKLARLKHRTEGKPFIKLFANYQDFQAFGFDVPGPVLSFMRGITFVLGFDAKIDHPHGIAVRWVREPFLLALMKKANCSLWAPSLNIEGKPTASSEMDILLWNKHVDLIVIDKRQGLSLGESTIVGYGSTHKPVILRQGFVSEQQIIKAWETDCIL